MNSESSRDRFASDVRELSNSLGGELEAGNVDESFRLVHSIKSIAAQAGYDEIASNAHEMESRLEAIRSGALELEGEGKSVFLRRLSTLQAQLDVIERGIDRSGAEDLHGPTLSEFESSLLSEATRRGERYYRLICTIDPESPLKRVRAHLVVNNLELVANVITTDPPLSELSDSAFGRFAVYLTTDVEEQSLNDAADVDEVRRVHLEPLSGGDDQAEDAEDSNPVEADSLPGVTGPFKVDPEALTRILARVDDADAALRELPPATEASVQHVLRILGSIRDTIGTVQRRPVAELFERLRSSAIELSRHEGKEVAVSVSGEETFLDTRIVDGVFEPLLHVVRNAIDHGIEAPAQRTASGKPSAGSLEIAAVERGGQIEISVRDDGRGIDRDKLRVEASKRNLDVSDDEQLLELLATPGYSTVDTANGVSGRGFGLDIVLRRITNMGGSVSLRGGPDGGTEIVVRIPLSAGEELHTESFTVLRSGKEMFSLSSANVTRVQPLDIALLKRDREGGVWFEGLPLYSVHGRLRVSDGVPRDGTLLLIQHDGRSGWLCVDKVIPERTERDSSETGEAVLLDLSTLI